MRDRIVCERTTLINHIRGLLGEYRVVLSAGAFRFRKQIAYTMASAPLSELASDLFSTLISEFRGLMSKWQILIESLFPFVARMSGAAA